MGARSVHDGSPVELINFVVSEPFVVATPRVRTAAKANIPHVDDHVKVHFWRWAAGVLSEAVKEAAQFLESV